jgi:hypothetical protein
MAEVLGAVAASIQLAQFAEKVYSFFREMATGYADTDGKISQIYSDLTTFANAADAVHARLRVTSTDDFGLRNDLRRYKNTLTLLS